MKLKTFYSHLDWPTPGTISHLFTHTYKLREVHRPHEADVIVWNGGEDIGTSIYNEEPIYRGIPHERSKRDGDEIKLFDSFAHDQSKLLVGICRGAQLLNCLNGGSLWQDVNGHTRAHDMIDLRSKEVIRVTSTHHQQMIPAKDSGEVIGIANCSTFKERSNEKSVRSTAKNIIDGVDVEIMWYPSTQSLLIQGHPEYVPGSRFAAYVLELMHEFSEQIACAA